jgi:hypothetical protein
MALNATIYCKGYQKYTKATNLGRDLLDNAIVLLTFFDLVKIRTVH